MSWSSEDIDEPLVEDDEVLVRVRATSVNPADWHLMTGRAPTSRACSSGYAGRRTRLGLRFRGAGRSGRQNVTAFQPGDEVFGSPFGRGFGTFAEYVCVPADLVAPKPANLTFEQAAAVPLAGLTALQGLRDTGRSSRARAS